MRRILHNAAMDYFLTLDEAWHFVVSRHTRDPLGIHGPRHWAVVERNALYLAEAEGANPILVSLFALFHDSRRINDNHDPEHGIRGGLYARELRENLRGLLPGEADFSRLVEACNGHTDITHHKDKTIATCWDADRLDLGRVGIAPHPDYLNTETAKILAKSRNLIPLEKQAIRPLQLHFKC